MEDLRALLKLGTSLAVLYSSSSSLLLTFLKCSSQRLRVLARICSVLLTLVFRSNRGREAKAVGAKVEVACKLAFEEAETIEAPSWYPNLSSLKEASVVTAMYKRHEKI